MRRFVLYYHRDRSYPPEGVSAVFSTPRAVEEALAAALAAVLVLTFL